MCDMWLGLSQALLSDDCGFSGLIMLLVWMEYLIAWLLMPGCSPVSQWPPVSGLVPWEMLWRRWRKVDRDAREEGFEEPHRECTRISTVCPKTAALTPNSTASLIIRYRCHTVCRELGLWKAEHLTHARHEDPKWFPHPSALFAEVMLPVACDQLNSLRIR